MPEPPQTGRQKLAAGILLLLLVPLGVLTDWVFCNLTQRPVYPTYSFPRNASAAVWNDTGPWHQLTGFPRTRTLKLDLLTGQQSALFAPWNYLLLRDSRGICYEMHRVDGYNRLVARNSHDDSTKVICKLPDLPHPSALVDERYVLFQLFDRVVAIDTQAVTDGEGQLIQLDLPDLTGHPGQTYTIDNTSMFVLPNPDYGFTNSAKIIAIESGQMKELAEFTMGAAARHVVVHDQRILYPAADGKSLQSRSIADVNTVRQLAAPQEIITSWFTANAGRTTLTFPDSVSGQWHTYRLSDFSKIDQLDGHVMAGNNQERDELTLFKPLTSHQSITVYDSTKDKVVRQIQLDHPYLYIEKINPSQAAAVDYRWGGTITVVDLVSARTVAVYRPIWWPMLGAIAMCVAGLAWCIAWLRTSARMHLPHALDWGLLIAILFIPALYRLVCFDLWSNYWRFAVVMVQCGTNTGLLAVSCYALYAPTKWPYRVLAYAGFLTLISAGIVALDHVRPALGPDHLGIAWTHFMTVGVASLAVASVFRFQLLPALRPQPFAHARSTIADWFVITAGISLILGVNILLNATMKEEFTRLKDDIAQGGWRIMSVVMVASLQVIATQAVTIWLLLAKNQTLYRLGLALGWLALAVIVAEPILTLVVSGWTGRFYMWITLLRLLALSYLLPAAWLWRVRTSCPPG